MFGLVSKKARDAEVRIIVNRAITAASKTSKEAVPYLEYVRDSLLGKGPSLVEAVEASLAVRTPFTYRDVHHLDWLAARLVKVYKEPEGVDFVLKLLEIKDKVARFVRPS